MHHLSKRAKQLLLLAGIILMLALIAWWRMGNVIIEVDEAALPPMPAQPKAIEFSVIAYNVQARPVFDKTGAKFDAMSPLLNPYDIVALQECFKNYKDLWEGTTHPARIYHNTRRHPFKLVNSGLSILGRFPLDGVESMHFSADGDGQNWPANKGILMARFRAGGMPLDVYTTHFAAGRKDRSMRDKPIQTREAIEFVEKHSPPDHAVIFLGDFNMKTLPEKDRMSAAEIDAAKKDLSGLNREQCFQVLKAALDLNDVMDELHDEILSIPDHILYRSGTTARLTPTRFQFDGEEFYFENREPLSDHEPLIAEFRLTPP
jgi:endonuclease/exonuclease/phosphatase family metal-dependent hydrolase